ncbi:unnamed protein product [Paramecium octaurelia]|uniref:Uncharacterized protein n=1 Tax=Paramecium octaurelia TaxID=43137 RepID=A0A8S1WDN2_PAROT|nr:unnamed protein product [Paramecium octaurelia]
MQLQQIIGLYVVIAQEQNGHEKDDKREQQPKLLIQNLEIKISNNKKQIELLTTYTQKAIEETKSEFTFAIDLLAERENSLNILKDAIKRQTELIATQKQQLISVQVLEHKMGHLGEKQTKRNKKSNKIMIKLSNRRNCIQCNLFLVGLEGKIEYCNWNKKLNSCKLRRILLRGISHRRLNFHRRRQTSKIIKQRKRYLKYQIFKENLQMCIIATIYKMKLINQSTKYQG